MEENDLIKTIAVLESKLDYVETELHELNQMLLDCGFPEGLKTLKETVAEILEECNRDNPPQKNPNSIDLL